MTELALQSVLLQLIVILAVAKVVGHIAKWCGQAEVVGQMIAGIVLGPSVFGALAPDAFTYVFAPSTAQGIGSLAQVGIVLLMFQIGLEFELTIVAASKRTVLMVGGFAIVVPFVIGLLASGYFFDALPAPRPAQHQFALFFGVAMSITALPVLARISAETGLAKTRAGAIAISAAALDDVVGWLLLGAILLTVTNGFSIEWLAVRIVGMVALLVFVFYVVRPGAHRYFERYFAKSERLEPAAIAMTLVAVLACAFATSRLGLHALIGAFILGVALHEHSQLVSEWRSRVAPLVNTMFLPIFFAQTGLRTDIGALGSGTEVMQCALICALAFAGKYGGGYAGARLAGEPHRVASVLGTCMNTRGLMELVVLNIGFEVGIIPRTLFTQFVYMAVLTTLVATPLIRRYLRADDRVMAKP